MAAKQSTEQQRIVGRVMHEWKQGKLRSGSGETVRDPKQAIAIGLSEAGESNQKPAKTNRRALSRTRQTGRAETREALYEQAKRMNVPGRSKMTKAQLKAAIG
jgi:hypothetical protein